MKNFSFFAGIGFLDRGYELAEFVDRARTALNTSSDRVRAKYGRLCGLEIAEIEANATQFTSHSESIVRVIEFIE